MIAYRTLWNVRYIRLIILDSGIFQIISFSLFVDSELESVFFYQETYLSTRHRTVLYHPMECSRFLKKYVWYRTFYIVLSGDPHIWRWKKSTHMHRFNFVLWWRTLSVNFSVRYETESHNIFNYHCGVWIIWIDR